MDTRDGQNQYWAYSQCRAHQNNLSCSKKFPPTLQWAWDLDENLILVSTVLVTSSGQVATLLSFLAWVRVHILGSISAVSEIRTEHCMEMCQILENGLSIRPMWEEFGILVPFGARKNASSSLNRSLEQRKRRIWCSSERGGRPQKYSQNISSACAHIEPSTMGLWSYWKTIKFGTIDFKEMPSLLKYGGFIYLWEKVVESSFEYWFLSSAMANLFHSRPIYQSSNALISRFLSGSNKVALPVSQKWKTISPWILIPICLGTTQAPQ